MRPSYNSTIENYDSLYKNMSCEHRCIHIHTYVHNISYSSKLVIAPRKKDIKVDIKEINLYSTMHGRAKPTPVLSEGAGFGGTVFKQWVKTHIWAHLQHYSHWHTGMIGLLQGEMLQDATIKSAVQHTWCVLMCAVMLKRLINTHQRTTHNVFHVEFLPKLSSWFHIGFTTTQKVCVFLIHGGYLGMYLENDVFKGYILYIYILS